MDRYKLKLIRERDNIWAEVRNTMPLFEKFFAQDTSHTEDVKIGWISIKLIATELYTYNDEIKNISQELLDIYDKEIKGGEIDTLKFANGEIETLKNKIIEVGRDEETREQVEVNLEEIREYIKNIRLIFLYNMLKYRDIVGHMLLGIMNGDFIVSEHNIVKRQE